MGIEEKIVKSIVEIPHFTHDFTEDEINELMANGEVTSRLSNLDKTREMQVGNIMNGKLVGSGSRGGGGVAVEIVSMEPTGEEKEFECRFKLRKDL